MLETIFNPENAVFCLMNKMLDLMVLSLVWALCCIPIITAGQCGTLPCGGEICQAAEELSASGVLEKLSGKSQERNSDTDYMDSACGHDARQ